VLSTLADILLNICARLYGLRFGGHALVISVYQYDFRYITDRDFALRRR
jgi:hypothetical protein